MPIWLVGHSRQMRSTRSTMRSVSRPLVGMVMTDGRQCRYALMTISSRSLRRNGSPPVKVM